MTKVKLTILGLITLFLGTTISCSKDETTTATAEKQNSMFNKKEEQILKSKYGFKSVSPYMNITASTKFKSLETNRLTNEIIGEYGDLDLDAVTETNWEDGSISYFVAFKDNKYKSLVISQDKSGVLDYDSAVTIENNVDTKGTGSITVVTKDGTIQRVFQDGKEISNTAGKRSFRECFDAAYNSVCDDFIGCVAWYSNPGVPLAAAAYCQVHG